MSVYSVKVMTQQGLALYAKAQTGVQLNFTRMQVGSGQLGVGQDAATLTSLITPISYFPVNSITSSGNTAHIKGIFENGGLIVATYVCEVGIFAMDPQLGEILYAYANAGTQGDYIPPISAGSYPRSFQISPAIGNASNVTITVPAQAYAPLDSPAFTGAPTAPTSPVWTKNDNLATNNFVINQIGIPISYGVTTGTNSYSVSPFPAFESYVDGAAVSVKISVTNTAAASINVNGLGAKSILDSKGNVMTAGKLKQNSIYTMRYNGTAFILQGEGGGGNATAGDMRAGKTATVDSGDIVGSLVDRGAMIIAPSGTGQISIPDGIHLNSKVSQVNVPANKLLSDTNVAGVQGAMPDRSGSHWVATGINGTSVVNRLFLRPYSGYFDGIYSVFADDSNFIAANIPFGKSMFGLAGLLQVMKSAKVTYSGFDFTVTGLNFTPVLIISVVDAYYNTAPPGNGYSSVVRGTLLYSTDSMNFTSYDQITGVYMTSIYSSLGSPYRFNMGISNVVYGGFQVGYSTDCTTSQVSCSSTLVVLGY